MRQALNLHPDFRCDAVSGIEVDVERPAPGQLLLRYRLSGVTDALVWPPALPAERTDGLWRRTCFEAFVRAPPDEGYRELNVATGAWAAYQFDGYRQGMAEADIGPPDVQLNGVGGDIVDLLVIWDLDLPRDAAWRVGISAVIEAVGGRRSYWALAHPPGQADFHHADCFALEVAAPDRP